MDKLIDLHIHSSYSEDGDFSVDEIFRKASEKHLSAISITDHDSIESIPVSKMVKGEYEIEYIPGVELTTVFPVDGSQQHLLGYFVDENNPDLKTELINIHEYRISIAGRRIEALRRIGFEMDAERIWKMVDGRAPTATSIMVEIFINDENKSDKRLKEYYQGPKAGNRLPNFYREFLAEGKPAYVPFESVPLEKGIEVICRAGGIPVLAHPVFVKSRMWLGIIVDYGIKGIEAISTYHTDDDIKFYIEFAEKNSLLITAGSDFHGPTSKPDVGIGKINGRCMYLENLRAFYNETAEK